MLQGFIFFKFSPLPAQNETTKVTISKGMDKPYFDRNGVIWLFQFLIHCWRPLIE